MNHKIYPLAYKLSPNQTCTLLKEGRKNFTEEEWLEIMLRSCGYEPDKLNDRERWLLLARMLPLVENNFNLCELGPRSTGKSHIYKEISPNSILVSGGQTTVANLFYNMGRKTVGLVGLWDCVAFDEVAGINFKDKDGIQIMKDYMASGSFARGKEEKAATASMVFVGNINQSVDVLLKTSSLFDPFPPEMGTDTAFLDRMHCYIPGWEIPKFRPEHFTNDYGFITDYLAEFIRELRKEQYGDALDKYFRLGKNLNQRDTIAVRKMVGGMIKLLYPDGEFTKEQLEEILKFALEMRRRVKEQLKKLGGMEFYDVNFSYIDNDTFEEHWQNKVLLHPDIERAKRLLAQGAFPDYEDICREILLVEYPEEVSHETAEDFDELSWESILDDVFASNTAKGIQMWRRLLDVAEPNLKTNAKTAEKLLPDWDWLDSPTDDQALPLLVALDDERFVSQLFESAYLDRLQFNVLEICRDCGEETLARHCMDLALKNPCLEEQWRKRYTQVLAAAPSSKRTKPPARALARPPVSTQKKPAGESYYQFCNVQFKEDGATYAYLTGGISLKAGDFVVVPIGDHQAEKLAQVTEVFVCSTQNAPYPPEKAKFVLRKSERTAFPERTKLQHPAPKQADVSTPTESKRAVPPVQSAPIENPQKSAPTVQSAITPPIVSQTPTEPEITEKKSTLSKKPVPLGKIIAAVLAVAVIAGISVSVSSRNKQRAAAYDAALQELSNGNYTSAEQGFSSLSGYRDAASLSVYCKYADMYKDRTDYAGGQDELANITLQYDTGWQQNIDALETRVKSYKAEKDAAEEAERQRIAAENAAKREQSLKDQYSGKLPVEGMPVSCLKYTSLGEPDKRLNCKNFEKLEQNQKYFNVYWYDGNGEMIAAGMCAQWRDDSEFMLKTFSQYYPSGSNKGQTFHYGNGDNNSGSIRDDYDTPEDLWEDNPDWYEDEDEAWDEWENG